MATLVLDNYDSFTFNLVHLLEQFDVAFEVHRNDEISVAEADRFDSFLFSPGPGLPKDAGVMPELINSYLGKKKILGVCLGMQAMLEHLGAKLENMEEVLHGRSTNIKLLNHDGLFQAMPNEIEVGRYHSWAVKELPLNLNKGLLVSSIDSKGYFMSVEWPEQKLYGLQFHPESIMTPQGKLMIKNWLEL